MKALYPTLALAALAFAACDDESYDNWADAQSNPNTTDSIATSFSVAPVDAIKFADLADDVDSIAIFTPTLTTTGAEADAITYKVILGNSTDEVATNNGVIDVATIKSAFETEFGKAPEQNELAATVVAYPTFGSVVSRETAKVSIIATLAAPVIEDAYYYYGTASGWDVSNATYKFTRADESVSKYDDPVFTVTIPASVDETGARADEWFKIATPADVEAGKEVNVLGGAENGATPLEATALVQGDNIGAFKMPASDGALYYKITLNMMDYTIVVTPIAYTSYIYVPGNGFGGWDAAKAPALYSPNADGKYTGYAYFNGGFKLTKERNWSTEYNYTYFTTHSDCFNNVDATNINCATAGMYYVEADLAAKSLKATLITSYGIIGGVFDANWGVENEMTWDATEGAYTWTGECAAGEYKFRANKDWCGINLGTSLDDLQNEGGNLSIAEAGNYTFKLYPLRNASEKIYATVTKN